VVEGNAAGLRSLARILLTLAAEDVPVSTHLHLDGSNMLEAESTEIILQCAPEPDPGDGTRAS
jgi:hypothetical protein